MTAAGRSLAGVELLARVEPACAGAGVGVPSDEDDKVAWLVLVAVFPAGGLAVAGDGEFGAWGRVVADGCDEGSRAA